MNNLVASIIASVITLVGLVMGFLFKKILDNIKESISKLANDFTKLGVIVEKNHTDVNGRINDVEKKLSTEIQATKSDLTSEIRKSEDNHETLKRLVESFIAKQEQLNINFCESHKNSRDDIKDLYNKLNVSNEKVSKIQGSLKNQE